MPMNYTVNDRMIQYTFSPIFMKSKLPQHCGKWSTPPRHSTLEQDYVRIWKKTSTTDR